MYHTIPALTPRTSRDPRVTYHSHYGLRTPLITTFCACYSFTQRSAHATHSYNVLRTPLIHTMFCTYHSSQRFAHVTFIQRSTHATSHNVLRMPTFTQPSAHATHTHTAAVVHNPNTLWTITPYEPFTHTSHYLDLNNL